MKRMYIVLLSLFIVGCAKEIDDKHVNHVNHQEEPIDYLHIISSFGYSTDDIVESDSLFLISGEVVVSKAQLKRIAETPETKLESYEDKIPTENHRIYLEYKDVNGAFLSVFNDAVREWNSLPNCNIVFYNPYDVELEPVGFNTHVNIFLSDDSFDISNNLNDRTYSFIKVSPMVFNPNNSSLAIDTNNTTWASLSMDQQKWAVVHALGLLVGLKPTEEYDSIMKGVSGLSSDEYGTYWSGFNKNDIRDLFEMYPLQLDSFDLASSQSVYQLDESYTFLPTIGSIKPVNDVTYSYSIETADSLACYECTHNDDDSISITFLASGTYSINCSVSYEGKVFATTTKAIAVEGDFNVNGPIKLNQFFDIAWGCGENETLTCAVNELLFGNNPNDVEIVQKSPSVFSICLKDYGKYVITLKKTISDEVGTRSFRKGITVEKYYRPDMIFPDFHGTTDNFDYRMKVFEIGYVCPESSEELSRMNVTSYNPSYNIKVMDGSKLKNRLYLQIYEKFYRIAFIPPAPVCKGPATCIDSPIDTTFMKGASTIIAMPEGRNGSLVLEPGWANYMGYYAAIIPRDKVTAFISVVTWE